MFEQQDENIMTRNSGLIWHILNLNLVKMLFVFSLQSYLKMKKKSKDIKRNEYEK